MKRIFLFLWAGTLSLAMNSCSDDDKAKTTPDFDPNGIVTYKLNGVTTTYTFINVEAIENGDSYMLNFTASNNGSSSDYVTFMVETGQTGADKLQQLQIIKNSEGLNTSCASNTVVNNTEMLQTNFSGTAYINGETVPLTDGSINIVY